MRLLYRILCRGCRSKQLRLLSSQSSTVDSGEINRFSKLSNDWWDEKGSLGALHTMNRLRIPLVKDSFSSLETGSNTPLVGKSILDVGCGGGILSEPMTRLGASVTGLDASEDGIAAALQRRDSLQDPRLDSNLNYICDTVEEFSRTNEESFDLVVASEVVEHVASLDSFVECCAKIVKPGGNILVTTVSKTYLSYWLAIFAAEKIFHMVPEGTHEWNKFVSPQDLQKTFEKYGCRQTLLHGMTLNILTLRWSWVRNTDINYASRFVKDKTVK